MQLKLLLFIPVILCLSFTNPVIKIKITNLKNNNGQVLLELSDADKNKINGVSQEIENKQCFIYIDNLKPGKYSFKYFHDENKNKKLDTNIIGMPKEGFGFSNNAKGTFGPPAHEKTVFEIKNDTTLICTPIYLKKK